MKKVLIVGGGASGMFCAVRLKEYNPSCDVTVLEAAASPMKKLLVTGSGRCNLSHRPMKMNRYDGDITPVVSRIIKDFDMEEEMAKEGLAVKWLGDLMYPMSEQARSVKDVLSERAETLGVRVLTDMFVRLVYDDNGLKLDTQKGVLDADAVVLAMGTRAGGQSGTHDREDIIRDLNLPVRAYEPMLAGMKTKVRKAWKGIRVKGVFTLTHQNKTLASEEGELLFAEDGVSGIAVMNLSRDYVPGCTLHLDLAPSKSADDLRTMIRTSPLDNPLTGILPERMAKDLAGEKDPAALIKKMTFDITGLRDARFAQAEKGGVRVRALTDDLESRAHPGLYVIGEMLNVTGVCGGYNLHFAFASADHVARALGEAL